MEVILLEKVHNLGGLGDRVRVKPGYGRNYLIPNNKAVAATPANVAAFEARRAELEQAQATALEQARMRATRFEGFAVTLTARAGSEGRLFGSVGTGDIAEAVSAAGLELERREVRLPGGPLREVGGHAVELHLHPDVNVHITVHVVGEADAGQEPAAPAAQDGAPDAPQAAPEAD